jgi:beta-lactamase class A
MSRLEHLLWGSRALSAPSRLCAMLLLAAAGPTLAGEPIAALQAEVARLAAPVGGVVGVAAWRLDGTGARLLVNADARFPMASTYKVAIAAAVLAQIDAGKLTLEQMVAVRPDQYVESEVIADSLVHPGVSLSVHNLLELMLTRSDNTATDVLMALAGGPRAVTAFVRSQGVQGLRVDRDTAGIVRDFFDLPPGNLGDAVAAASAADPKFWDKGALPNAEFDRDPRDTSTPADMARLLDRLFSGKALRPASTETLIAMMERNRTGDARFRARLPAGTRVAEKTGTLGGSVNDVGLITLPGDAGKVVLAIYLKESARPIAERETAIADIARAIYDYYLLETS